MVKAIVERQRRGGEFFPQPENECVYLQRFETREQTRDAVFDYIEVFYNRQCR